MSYHIYDARGSELYDITEITGDIEWGDSTDSIGADMSLTVFTGADFKVQGKDILILRNEEEELFRGIVSEATDPLTAPYPADCMILRILWVRAPS